MPLLLRTGHGARLARAAELRVCLQLNHSVAAACGRPAASRARRCFIHSRACKSTERQSQSHQPLLVPLPRLPLAAALPAPPQLQRWTSRAPAPCVAAEPGPASGPWVPGCSTWTEVAQHGNPQASVKIVGIRSTCQQRRAWSGTVPPPAIPALLPWWPATCRRVRAVAVPMYATCCRAHRGVAGALQKARHTNE